MGYDWHFDTLLTYWRVWGNGVLVTVALSVPVIVGGTLLGVPLVAALKSRIAALRWLARIYIDLFRAIPALVLLGTFYFCLPILIPIRISPFSTALLAMTLNLAPFAAECIRGGIESVSIVQYDSARAMGFQGWKLNYYIIGPQILRRITPPLVGEYVTTLKLTSLAATIGVPEIWHATGRVVTATSQPLEARLAGAALYVAIIVPFLWVSLWLERRFAVKGFGWVLEER
jgi:polar amino acid transport system permease protein